MFHPSTLVNRDGKLYIRTVDFDHREPKAYVFYWDLDMSTHAFLMYYDESRIGQPVSRYGPGTYKDGHGKLYHLVGHPNARAKFHEVVPVPPPHKPRNKHPLIWHNYAWYIDHPKKGRIRA